MPADLKLPQIGSSQLPTPFRGLHSPGVRKLSNYLCLLFPEIVYLNMEISLACAHSSGAVGESRWTSWAVRPNEPSGFRGRKDLLHRASALVTTCP